MAKKHKESFGVGELNAATLDYKGNVKNASMSKANNSVEGKEIGAMLPKKRKKKKLRECEAQPPTFVESVQLLSDDLEMSFQDFGLDEQLLKVIGELGWERPTLIQSRMIPVAFENKNILARARTGSGKTAAFMLPIVQRVLQLKSNSASEGAIGPFALFIVPSKELAKQIFTLLQTLTEKFPFLVSMNFAELNTNLDEDWLQENPDFVVSTPSRLLHALRKHGKSCDSVKHVVLDEADLLLSFGYADEMRQIKNHLPTNYQTIFTSATMTEDIEALKKLFIAGRSVVLMKLKEAQLPGNDQLSQYHILCRNDEERFTVFLALLKLKLIIGKSIIFVKNTDRCYQLGLFLQSFNIRSCILNAQMPVNSRCHVVEEFNEGKYFYVIASDINDLSSDSYSVIKEEDKLKHASDKEQKLSKRKRKHFDKESGVARGIDFHHVANVINFDFPTSVDSYIHRVGRTARGWNKGNALSFVSPEEKPFLEEVQEEISAQLGHRSITPYEIRIKELESFLLRTREVLAACTKTAIREARLAEIRAEVLRSKRLETYFAKNPREKAVMEHDKKLFTVNLHSPAIADVPDYMVPPTLRGVSNYRVEIKKKKGNRKRKMHPTANQIKYKRKMEDPLQSFLL